MKRVRSGVSSSTKGEKTDTEAEKAALRSSVQVNREGLMCCRGSGQVRKLRAVSPHEACDLCSRLDFVSVFSNLNPFFMSDMV